MTNKTKQLLTDLLIKVLLRFIGVRTWLIKVLVSNFAEQVIEVVTDVIDYVEIKHKVKGTIDEEDRDSATDTLNDIFN